MWCARVTPSSPERRLSTGASSLLAGVFRRSVHDLHDMHTFCLLINL
jgi:hypothetical protein